MTKNGRDQASETCNILHILYTLFGMSKKPLMGMQGTGHLFAFQFELVVLCLDAG